ncbi:putative reverse transcriptase domain-containing protein [Tanacetum coccineum]
MWAIMAELLLRLHRLHRLHPDRSPFFSTTLIQHFLLDRGQFYGCGFCLLLLYRFRASWVALGVFLEHLRVQILFLLSATVGFLGTGRIRFGLRVIVATVPSCFEQLDHVGDEVHDLHGGFTLALLDNLFSKRLRTAKSTLKCRLGFSRVLKGALDKVICKPNDISCWEESIINAIRSWGMPGGSLQLLRETLAKSSPNLSDVDDEDIDLGDRNTNDATLEDLKTKHPFKPAPYLPHIPYDHHHLIASLTVVLDIIKSFSRGTSCGRDGLRTQHLIDCLSGYVVAVSDELVSSITQVVNLILDRSYPKMLGEYIASAPFTPLVKPGDDGYLDDLQFGVGVSGGSEAILHVVNRLIEGYGDDVGLSMFLVDFKNAFNLVGQEVMLREIHLRCPDISRWVEFCYSNLARLYYGEHTLCSCQGVQQGDPLGPLLFALVLHPLICKIRNSFTLSLQAWYLDDGTIVGDTLVVGKVLELIMEDGPWYGLHLNVDKTEVFWPKEDPRSRLTGVFSSNIARPSHGVKLLGRPSSVDFDFCSQLVMKRVAKTIELMDAVATINDPQCELLLLRSCTGISNLYFSMRTCSPHVFESAQHYFNVALHSSLERIVTASGPGFASDVLNYAFLASRLQSAGLQTMLLRHTNIMALWKSQMEDHTSDWLRTVPIFGLGQTMNACSRVFARDIYGDHAVSCAGIIGIKHRHNIVRDTLIDICYRSGILAGKEVGIGSSNLRQTGMADFVPGRVVIEAAQRKRGKYMDKCAAIGYGFLPFSFSSLGELEADAVILMKQIRKFSVTQDTRVRVAVHIFNRIGFSIAKGVGAQIVSRLPSNFL